jgi:hypothetical protein
LLIDQASSGSPIQYLGLFLVLGYDTYELMLLAAIVFLPFSLFLSVGCWPYGSEVILAGPFFDITVESTTEGYTNCSAEDWSKSKKNV